MTKAVPLTEWSAKLPPWGTTSDGAVSEHPTPECLTAVRGGSQLLPTPTHWVQDEVDLDADLERRQREKAKDRNGNGFGLTLDMAVRLLPTPTGRDWKGRNQRNDTSCLPGAVQVLRLLPTPTVSYGRNQTSGRQPGSKHHSGTTLLDLVFLCRSDPTRTPSDSGN